MEVFNMTQYTVKHGNEYMQCNDKGEVIRPKIGMNEPSGQWYLTGAVRFNNFGYRVEMYSLREILTTPLQWQYKDGKQRIHITDYDHGSARTWVSPNHAIII